MVLMPSHVRCTHSQEAMADPGKSHMLLLSNPNVAGSTYSKEELQEIATICRRFQMLCVSDESWSPLIFGGDHEDGVEHHSIATYYPEGNVIYKMSMYHVPFADDIQSMYHVLCVCPICPFSHHVLGVVEKRSCLQEHAKLT